MKNTQYAIGNVFIYNNQGVEILKVHATELVVKSNTTGEIFTICVSELYDN